MNKPHLFNTFFPEISQEIESADLNRKIRGLEKLEKLKSPKSIPLLLNTLNDENSTVRIKALHGLRDIRNDSLVSTFLNMADDSNENVRHEAIISLTWFSCKPAVKALNMLLENSFDPQVRAKAVEALLQLDCAYNSELWVSKLADHSAPEIQDKFLSQKKSI